MCIFDSAVSIGAAMTGAVSLCAALELEDKWYESIERLSENWVANGFERGVTGTRGDWDWKGMEIGGAGACERGVAREGTGIESWKLPPSRASLTEADVS